MKTSLLLRFLMVGALLVVGALVIGKLASPPRRPEPAGAGDESISQEEGSRPGSRTRSSRSNDNIIQQQAVEAVSNAWLVAVQVGDVDQLKQLESEILGEPARHVAWLRGIMVSHDVPADAREFAAGLLARIGTPEAVSSLFSAYREEMGMNGASDNLLRAFDFVTNSAASGTLARCAVESSDPRGFAAMVSAAARCADSDQVQQFFERFTNPSNDRDLFVSQTILQKVPASELAPYLQQAVSGITNPTVLVFVASKLGDDGSPASIDALRQSIASADGNKRTVLLDGLFRVRSQQALPVLEGLAVTDQDRSIRQYAIYALANYPAEIANPVLDRLDQDSRATEMRKEIEFVRRFVLKRQQYLPTQQQNGLLLQAQEGVK